MELGRGLVHHRVVCDDFVHAWKKVVFVKLLWNALSIHSSFPLAVSNNINSTQCNASFDQQLFHFYSMGTIDIIMSS